MILDDNRIDELIKKALAYVPDDLKQTRHDVEQNLKTGLQSALSRMDLVTREEYDVQVALLQRTREKLEVLEEQVRELEQQTREEGSSR